jgi:nitroreductase
MIKELVYKNRSYRRFYQNEKITMETLEELIDLARHSACVGNLQSLKYILSCDPRVKELIFKKLGWAGLFKGLEGTH